MPRPALLMPHLLPYLLADVHLPYLAFGTSTLCFSCISASFPVYGLCSGDTFHKIPIFTSPNVLELLRYALSICGTYLNKFLLLFLICIEWNHCTPFSRNDTSQLIFWLISIPSFSFLICIIQVRDYPSFNLFFGLQMLPSWVTFTFLHWISISFHIFFYVISSPILFGCASCGILEEQPWEPKCYRITFSGVLLFFWCMT